MALLPIEKPGRWKGEEQCVHYVNSPYSTQMSVLPFFPLLPEEAFSPTGKKKKISRVINIDWILRTSKY